MAENKGNPKPIAQVVVFELLAAYGLIRLLQTGAPEDPWTVRFVYNACFFLAAYPFLAFWRSGGVPGLLRFLLFPVGWALRGRRGGVDRRLHRASQPAEPHAR